MKYWECGHILADNIIHENNLHFRSSVNFLLQCYIFPIVQHNHIFLYSLLIHKCLRTDVDSNIPSFIVQELIKWRYCEVNKSQVSCELSIIPDWPRITLDPEPKKQSWSAKQKEGRARVFLQTSSSVLSS